MTGLSKTEPVNFASPYYTKNIFLKEQILEMKINSSVEIIIFVFRIELHTTAGALKLWISPFLMEFGFLKLEFGNQIWKFMCR